MPGPPCRRISVGLSRILGPSGTSVAPSTSKKSLPSPILIRMANRSYDGIPMTESMINASVAGIDLRFETEASLFSPTKLDRGSLAMLSCISFAPNDKVLDLGCGYGLIGIYAAKGIGAERVWMVDNDQTAAEYAAKNLAVNGVRGVSIVLSDGFRELRETSFTKIVCNPPYHVDFSVPKHFIEKGFN